jgi:hypothetical protein
MRTVKVCLSVTLPAEDVSDGETYKNPGKWQQSRCHTMGLPIKLYTAAALSNRYNTDNLLNNCVNYCSSVVEPEPHHFGRAEALKQWGCGCGSNNSGSRPNIQHG